MAVKTAVPMVVDLTVKVAMPELLVVPFMVVMTGLPGPEVLASVTLLPAMGLLLASLRVTVMVEVAEPSANTALGAATTVELLALSGTVVARVSFKSLRLASCLTMTMFSPAAVANVRSSADSVSLFTPLR